MSEKEEKAFKLIENANKKLGPWVLGGIFTGAKKTEEALEMLNQAANLFKMAKNWTQAGNTFKKIANHHGWRKNKHEAATNFVAAANCYRKTDHNEAITNLEKAISIYLDMGRFIIVARQHQTIAEIYEGKGGDLAKAMEHFELAAEYFKAEDSTSSAKKCLVKVAEYSAIAGRFDTAISIYEQVASEALDSNLLKYGAKDYYFRACLCNLAVAVIKAEKSVKMYIDHYPAFEDTREAKLIWALCKAVREQDLECFNSKVKQYESLSRLDPWYHSVLLKIKEHIPDENDLC